MTGYAQRQWEKKFFSSGARCYYCELPLLLNEAQREHMVPLARGGTDLIANIVPSCARCNLAKGTMTVEEFLNSRRSLRTLSENSTAITKTKSNDAVNFPEENNEPGLLRRVMSERDGMRASWAWRNPA